MKIAVLGGGNGCYAAAADLSEAGHEVSLWRRDAAALQPVIDSGCITLKDAGGMREVRIARATADIGVAVHEARLIVIPSPATAQADIARAIAPHLRDGQVVFLPPGTFGGYMMADLVRSAGRHADVLWAETGTLPYLARKHGVREVNVTVRAIHLPTGVYPARRADEAVGVIRAGLSGGARLRRHPVGRADERRADHPSAADGDERGAAAALRHAGTSTPRARSRACAP